MLCAEWWAFEVLALVAGTFDNGGLSNQEYVSAFTVCLNVLGIFIRIPIGISFACAVLVANKLGSGYGNAAKIAWNSAVIISCGLLLFLFSLFF